MLHSPMLKSAWLHQPSAPPFGPGPPQVLDVSRCPNIGGDALDLHPRCVLEVLRAAGCNALRSVVIQLPPDAPLRALNLESCRQLHEVLVVAHRLQELSLSHCGQLRHVSLRCRWGEAGQLAGAVLGLYSAAGAA